MKFQVVKVADKWYIYHKETGTLITKTFGRGTKKEAERVCKLYNKVNK